jgi:hypothetical protein
MKIHPVGIQMEHFLSAEIASSACCGLPGALFFYNPRRMDTPAHAGAPEPTPAQLEQDKRERERQKHRRFYEKHKEKLREKAHVRYFSRVHNISNPPPLRSNLRVNVEV